MYLIGALLPFTRELFSDSRTGHLAGGEVALRMFVTVPLGTVLLEEYAFRGVLYGLVRRSHGVLAATAVSSVLFGLWHVLPSLSLATEKPALTAGFGHTPIGAVVTDIGAVLFTAAAGVLFCELRRRSDSLLAPIGLHWATNALGYLTAFVLVRTREPPGGERLAPRRSSGGDGRTRFRRPLTSRPDEPEGCAGRTPD